LSIANQVKYIEKEVYLPPSSKGLFCEASPIGPLATNEKEP